MIENFAEVVADDLFVYVECRKLVSRFATVNVQHALAQECVNRSVLVFGEHEGAVLSARRMEAVLVAYWFKHDYDRIAKRLNSSHLPFSKLDTEDSIRKWNKGEIPVALIHPASAGHGLNLQEGGSTFVWFGLTWSLELYQQANARLWRQGQKDTVVIQHIVAKNTIDERIMKALSEKDSTQSALIEAVKAII